MELTFKVMGQTQMARNLRVLAKDIAALEPFFKAAIQIIEARSDSLWASTGGNVEKANTWPPLAPSTLLARANRWGYYKRSPSRPTTLRWTGALQDSRARAYSDKYGRLEFTDFKAAFHQAGGGHLPRRVVIDLSNPTNAEIVRALQVHVHRAVGIFGRQA